MNSTRNNSFQKAALKLFSDVYDLIKEDKNIKINEIDDNQLKLIFLGKNMDVWAFLLVLISMMKKLKYLRILIDIVLLILL